MHFIPVNSFKGIHLYFYAYLYAFFSDFMIIFNIYLDSNGDVYLTDLF